MRPLAVFFASLALVTGGGAQTIQPPRVYTVTASNSMFGPVVDMKVLRNGSKALIEQDTTGDKAVHTRTYYDLKTSQSYTWNALNPAAGCSVGKFTGNWGDPYADSADLTGQLAKQNAKPIGTETVRGFSTNVFEAPLPEGQGSMKAWIEQKSGLIVKLQAITTGEPRTFIEVTEVSLQPPPDSAFALPPSCVKAAMAPDPPTEAEHIAAITGGGNPQDFQNANMGPASANSCTVLFRIVRAGTMEPITSGFQAAVDLTFDVNNPPHYTTGLSDTVGQSSFAGGSIRDVTSQLHNGVLTIPDVPKQFHMEVVFGKGGSASASVYRQCPAPKAVLLLVVKNPLKLSDGADWLWIKSGKYVTLTP